MENTKQYMLKEAINKNIQPLLICPFLKCNISSHAIMFYVIIIFDE